MIRTIWAASVNWVGGFLLKGVIWLLQKGFGVDTRQV